MAGKFMKIKKLVIPFISLVILTSQLTGCAVMSQEDIAEELANGTEIEIEMAVPDTSTQNKNELNVNGESYIIDTAYGDNSDSSYSEESEDSSEDSEVGVLENIGTLEDETPDGELIVLEGDQLYAYFLDTYRACRGFFGSFEYRLGLEISTVGLYESNYAKLPDNYAELYTEWRYEKLASTQYGELFNRADETVYAIADVNMRVAPTTSSESVGQLGRGESIHRIGIGQGIDSDIFDKDPWSKCELSDGTIVYIATEYLSTTKPSGGSSHSGGNTSSSSNSSNNGAGNTSSSSNNGGGNNNGSSGSTQQTQQSTSSGDSGWSNWVNPMEGLTEEEKQAEIQRLYEESKAAGITIGSG